MAGLGAGVAATRNRVSSCILEASDCVGGLCQSSTVGDCTFDYGPKLLLLDDSNNSEEILGFLEGNFEKYLLQEKLFSSEYGLLDYPVQRNLIDLPTPERRRALDDISSSWNRNRPITSYRDWLIDRYGNFLCENILFPYEYKKWQMPLDNLDYAWAQRRSVNENLEDILIGSQTKLPPNKSYYYPAIGSIATLSECIAKNSGIIKLKRSVNSIDLFNRVVDTGAERYRYDKLVSTLPLKSVAMMTKGVPEDLLEETYSCLHTLPIRLYNFVFNGACGSNSTVIYFPDTHFIFRRVSVVGNLCPSLSREGKTLLSVEVSFTPSANLTDYDEYLDTVLYGIRQIPEFAELGSLIAHQVLDFEHAYPIQRKGTREVVKKLQNFYAQHDVYHCGRGGSFDYCNSDKAYLQGKKLVDGLFVSTGI